MSEYHYFVGLSFLISAFLAALIIPRILLISAKKRLFDEPDKRKVHQHAVPRLGGVSFFPTILFTFCVVMAARYLYGYTIEPVRAEYLIPECLLLVCGMTLLYLIGIADDLIGVRYRQKFVVQIICASFFPLSGLWINNLYGIFGVHLLSPVVGIPFTILMVVFITNAINLIDGIDGLASGLSSVALLVFGVLFIQKELWAYAIIAFSTFGVLVPFFYFNVFGNPRRSRKLFMGDTGSLTLGYIISFLAIKYTMYNPEVVEYTEGAIVIAFSTLIVPAFDVIRVIFVRFRNGKDIFEPDKNHIHHKFLAMGISPRKTMIILIAMGIGFSVMNIALMPFLNNNVVLLVDVVVWIGLNMWWSSLRDQKQQVALKKKFANK